jgi:hypothetical protein
MTLWNVTCRLKISEMAMMALVGALFASTGAHAGDAKEPAAAGDASEPAADPGPPGKAVPRMVVTIDRDTGRLRPATPAERAALAASGRRVLERTGEATVIETKPDGSLHARLGPEFFRWSVASINPDGTISYEGAPAKKAPPAPER